MNSQAPVVVFIVMLWVTAGIAYLAMMNNRSQHVAESTSPTRNQAVCPPSIGARLFNRSVYREADNGEGVLVCFYDLPPVK